MIVRDLLPLLSIPLLGALVLHALAPLAPGGDLERRIVATSATPFARVAEMATRLSWHLMRAIAGDARGVHLQGAFVTFCSLAIVSVPPVLAAFWSARPPLSAHWVALAVGGALWATVVELPGAHRRMPRMPWPPLALTGTVVTLDAVVVVIAGSGVIADPSLSAFIAAMAFVAAADAASALLGLIDAAYEL